jgi:hypothetical protein
MSTILGPTGLGRDEEVGLLIKKINTLTSLWLSKPVMDDQPYLMSELVLLYIKLQTIYPHAISGV